MGFAPAARRIKRLRKSAAISTTRWVAVWLARDDDDRQTYALWRGPRRELYLRRGWLWWAKDYADPQWVEAPKGGHTWTRRSLLRLYPDAKDILPAPGECVRVRIEIPTGAIR